MFTIDHQGTEKSLAEWGLSQLTRRLVSQGADEVTFVADGRAADAPALFAPFADTLVIRRDRMRDSGGVWSGGTVWFAGIVTAIPRRGSPDAESNLYRVAGPWWYLETLVFEKTFNLFNGWTTPNDPNTPPTYRQETFSHCFLNLASTTPESPLGKLTTGQQIIEALQWALKPFVDAGAPPPFQIGQVTPALEVPFDEARDLTCAEVIHKMLRWSPDAVTWFDYTTTPPKFHCARRSELAAVDLPLNALPPTFTAFHAAQPPSGLIRDIRINPRHDLQSSYVLIRYEQTQTVDGFSWLVPTIDQWPPSLPANPQAAFNALRFTVDLQGFRATTTRVKLTSATLLPETAEWWLARHPEYKTFPQTVSDPKLHDPSPDNPMTAFAIVPGSIQRQPTNPAETDQGYGFELVSGQVADWMTTVRTQRLTMSCKANITHRNGQVVRNHPVTYQCLAMNVFGGTFTTQQVSAFAEPVPVGLAKFLHDAVSILQYEGELTLQEEECSGLLSIGSIFNLTNAALPEWASMNALVQQVTENADTGTTTVEFGPPRNLSAGELVDLLRVNRNRLIHYSPGLATSGSLGGASEVELGERLPERNSGAVPGYTQTHVVSSSIDGSGQTRVTGVTDDGFVFSIWKPAGVSGFDPAQPPPAGSVMISLRDIEGPDAAAGAAVRLRKVRVCKDGAPGTMYLLASDFIPDASGS